MAPALEEIIVMGMKGSYIQPGQYGWNGHIVQIFLLNTTGLREAPPGP